ncbi:ATP-binding protein [Chitinivorax sp. B]|uniref:ATP-binding protein n=1 Tax=Chitinivorax sp. B TaxID=2502235 RepID=UPI001485BBDC|nr:ATP-binding protein [Chitinivorax sp. B]
MASLHDAPVSKKIALAILFASSAAFLLAVAAMLSYELTTVHNRVLKDLLSKAELVALNLHAALNFEDTQSAMENLAVLKKLPEISAACLYKRNRQPFAGFANRQGKPCSWPKEFTTPNHRFDDNDLTLLRPVIFSGETAGYLYLRYTMPPLHIRLLPYGVLLLLILSTLALGALFSLKTLRRLVSDPIVQLANLTAAVTEHQQYQLRAQVLGKDEVGLLSTAFNTMLSTIELREKALKESQVLLQAIIDNAPAVIYVKHLDGRYAFVNHRFEQLFQHSKAEVLQRTDFDIFPAEQAQAFRDIDLKVIEARTPLEIEEVLKKDDGYHAYISVKFPLIDDRGQQYAVCGILTDITDRKRAEDELMHYRDHLEELVDARTRDLAAANHELETFSYTVSHDLRAPLRAISGFGTILLEDYSDELNDAGRQLLERQHKAATRMEQMIEDLLMLSQTVRAEPRLTRVNLSTIAQEVADELRGRAPWRNVRFVITPAIEVDADCGLIRQVLQNLFENAWKYSSQQPSALIEFGRDEQEGTDCYFVRDNGVGFDMKFADKLFSPFRRLHSDSEFEGTGIGLATVQRIIQRHHGNIWAKSAPGSGATFYFTLPSKGGAQKQINLEPEAGWHDAAN